MTASGKDRRCVLVTGTGIVPDEVVDLIQDQGFDVRRIRQDAFTPSELETALDGVSGYLLGGDEAPSAAHFDRADRLEAIAFVGTDYQAHVTDWQRAFDLGIAFINAPGANAQAVAEFTMLLMLTMARPFTGRVSPPGAAPAPLGAPGVELHGRTLGVIGAGRIGARVAAMAARGFGMRVLYTAPRRNPALEQIPALEYVALADLLDSSDIITLHRPGRKDQHEPFAIDAATLAQIRPGTALINAGHPSLIDPEALLAAAQTKGIRAAFDGYGRGPAWERLISLGPERILCLPQMGFQTIEANLRASTVAATSICEVLSGTGTPVLNNPDYLEVRRSLGRFLGPAITVPHSVEIPEADVEPARTLLRQGSGSTPESRADGL